jgi:hypothetical protein
MWRQKDDTSSPFPLQSQCDYNVTMAKEDKDTISFSVTLPVEAVEMLENLIPVGLYGKKRPRIAFSWSRIS